MFLFGCLRRCSLAMIDLRCVVVFVARCSPEEGKQFNIDFLVKLFSGWYVRIVLLPNSRFLLLQCSEVGVCLYWSQNLSRVKLIKVYYATRC